MIWYDDQLTIKSTRGCIHNVIPFLILDWQNNDQDKTIQIYMIWCTIWYDTQFDEYDDQLTIKSVCGRVHNVIPFQCRNCSLHFYMVQHDDDDYDDDDYDDDGDDDDDYDDDNDYDDYNDDDEYDDEDDDDDLPDEGACLCCDGVQQAH